MTTQSTSRRVPTYREAMAIGQDAGNRSMRARGLIAWDSEAWEAACDALALIGWTIAKPRTEHIPHRTR